MTLVVFHHVTVGGSSGSLMLSKERTAFRSYELEPNRSFDLKWSDIMKVTANKATSSGRAKLRISLSDDDGSCSGKRDQVLLTFPSRSELETARSRMKSFKQKDVQHRLHTLKGICDKGQTHDENGNATAHSETSLTSTTTTDEYIASPKLVSPPRRVPLPKSRSERLASSKHHTSAHKRRDARRRRVSMGDPRTPPGIPHGIYVTDHMFCNNRLDDRGRPNATNISHSYQQPNNVAAAIAAPIVDMNEFVRRQHISSVYLPQPNKSFSGLSHSYNPSNNIVVPNRTSATAEPINTNSSCIFVQRMDGNNGEEILRVVNLDAALPATSFRVAPSAARGVNEAPPLPPQQPPPPSRDNDVHLCRSGDGFLTIDIDSNDSPSFKNVYKMTGRSNNNNDNQERGGDIEEGRSKEAVDDVATITTKCTPCSRESCMICSMVGCCCLLLVLITVFLLVYFLVLKDQESSADRRREAFYANTGDAFWV